MTDRPLSGIRVLDFTRVLAGPHATRMLLDLGAEVVKLEPPEGDITRTTWPRVNSISSYFAQQNAGKRCISIHLDSEEGRALVLRLVAAPFDAVAVAAGVLGLDFKAFMAASFLGTIAGTIAFVSFGSSIESLTDGQPSIDAPLLALSIGLTAAGLLVSRWLRSRRPELAA